VRVQRNNSNVTKCAQNIKQQALETSVLLPCKRALLHISPKSSHFFPFSKQIIANCGCRAAILKNERGISLLQLHGTVVAKHSGPGQKTWDVEISNYSLFLFSIISSLEKHI